MLIDTIIPTNALVSKTKHDSENKKGLKKKKIKKKNMNMLIKR